MWVQPLGAARGQPSSPEKMAVARPFTCVLFVTVVHAQRPLRSTYHYHVDGEWIGPEISLGSPDHPLHPAHRRRLSEGGAAEAIRIFGTIALTAVAGTVSNDIGQPAGTQLQLTSHEDIFGPHEAGFTARQDGVIQDQMGCSTPSLCYSDGGVDTKTAQVRVTRPTDSISTL